MSYVYQNAALTIAAVGSTLYHESVGTTRSIAQKQRPFCPHHLEEYTGQKLRHLLSPGGSNEDELYVFLNSSERNRGTRLKGLLDRRGWILQEQLLSPRILYQEDG